MREKAELNKQLLRRQILREKVSAPHRLTSDGVDDSQIESNEEEERENHRDKDFHVLLVHLPKLILSFETIPEHFG